MKYIILALALVGFSGTSMAQTEIRDDLNDRRNFVMIEYAPNSNHLSDDDAPVQGYNEDNDLIIAKIGREYDWKQNLKYSLSVGLTTFENSYYDRSYGLGVGAEANYSLNRNLSIYGGGDFGFVSGYEGNVDDDYLLFDDYVPFLSLNTGLEYEFNDHLPTIRGGVKYVPASIVGSDDVVALTIGSRLKF